MGFFYWGRRADQIEGVIYDQTGTAVTPAATYSFPIKQGQRSTSQTLLTCPAYSSYVYHSYWPHAGKTDSFTQSAIGKVTSPGNGSPSYPSSAMQGICCAYIDGSARWVPRKQLWSMYEGGFDWVYFDHTNP